MVVYYNVLVTNKDQIVENRANATAGGGVLGNVFAGVASLVWDQTDVSNLVAQNMRDLIAQLMLQKHGARVQVHEKGVWGNFFVLEIEVAQIAQATLEQSRGLFPAIGRLLSCEVCDVEGSVLRNIERSLAQKMPSEVRALMLQRGVRLEITSRTDFESERVFAMEMIHKLYPDAPLTDGNLFFNQRGGFNNANANFYNTGYNNNNNAYNGQMGAEFYNQNAHGFQQYSSVGAGIPQTSGVMNQPIQAGYGTTGGLYQQPLPYNGAQYAGGYGHQNNLGYGNGY